eukprot:3982340-Prymnesium_polylepis.3
MAVTNLKQRVPAWGPQGVGRQRSALRSAGGGEHADASCLHRAERARQGQRTADDLQEPAPHIGHA